MVILGSIAFCGAPTSGVRTGRGGITVRASKLSRAVKGERRETALNGGRVHGASDHRFWLPSVAVRVAGENRNRKELSMKLLTDAQRRELTANGERSAAGEEIDPRPVVKLFTPDAGATWLLTELDPSDPDRAFGLCDLGLGFPELGYVSLAELAAVRGRLGLPVECDLHFTADRPLSAYTDAARHRGRIVT